jgi:preprotein translocase subunit YajC
MWFISDAMAQTAPAAAGGTESMMTSILFMVLIFVVFYFLLIRPQQQKMRAHREMIEQLKKGDKVVTSGGILGQVVRIEDGKNTATVEIAKDVRVEVVRSTISDVVRDTPQAPVNENKPTGSSGQGLLQRLFKK